MIASLERRRAATAVSLIGRHLDQYQPTGFWEDYNKFANALPMVVRQQGLARALALALAGAKKHGQRSVLSDLCAAVPPWHQTAGEPTEFADLIAKLNNGDPENKISILIEQAIALDFWSYTVLQREILEVLAWLKTLSKPHTQPPALPAERRAGRQESQA